MSDTTYVTREDVEKMISESSKRTYDAISIATATNMSIFNAALEYLALTRTVDLHGLHDYLSQFDEVVKESEDVSNSSDILGRVLIWLCTK